MQQRQLGPEGPLVGAIGLGGMPMSISASRPSVDDSVRVLLRAAELGVTLWDTADAYCLDDTETGHNERLFGAALKQLSPALREKIVIATKGGHVRPGGRWETDGWPEHIHEAVDASLKALGVDQIDLYQFHRPDPKVPFEETVGAFADIYKAGKVRFVGLSNVSAAQIESAIKIVPVISVQNHYSPQHRGPELDGVLDKCRELGLALLAYMPLGGIGGAKSIGETGKIGEIATALGVSPQRVALAWLLSKYDRLIPIPGASKVTSIEDSAKAESVTLSPEQIASLDRSFA